MTAVAAPPARKPLGAAPLLAIVAALGILLVALGNDGARTGRELAQPLFWSGLVAIYAPIAFRLLSPSVGRSERVALVAVLSISLFLVKLLYSPTQFVFYDELGWWRATNDLLQSGHPFSSNPLVITTPAFPGLDLLTAPLDMLARLSIFLSGTIVVGVARTAFMLALFLFFERATRSSRAAGIGVLVYACNPSFLYFNAQFAYESVALLLGVALLLLTARWIDNSHALSSGPTRSLLVAMATLVCALTVTHHITAYAVLALLIGWSVFFELAQRRGGGRPRNILLTPALPAVMLAVTASAWFAFVAGGLTVTEVGGQVSGSIRSAFHLVFGGSGPKKPFEAGAQTNTTLARAVAVISVLTLLAAIPPGLKRMWRPSVKAPLARALALLAVLYVVTLGLRLTQSGTETSQRASEFVFLGLGFLVAIVVASLRWPFAGTGRALAVTGLTTLVFLGGFIIGEPPQGRQPGPFLVSAERRSISPQGLAAAQFAGQHLKPGSRILVDHANATLMGSYGGLDPVTRRVNGVSISRVFFDRTLDRPARRVILEGHIRYIVVDRRLSRSIPVQGTYFGLEEPHAFERKNPIPPPALDKFRYVRGLTKIYANGPIEIYDTYGLTSG